MKFCLIIIALLVFLVALSYQQAHTSPDFTADIALETRTNGNKANTRWITLYNNPTKGRVLFGNDSDVWQLFLLYQNTALSYVRKSNGGYGCNQVFCLNGKQGNNCSVSCNIQNMYNDSFANMMDWSKTGVYIGGCAMGNGKLYRSYRKSISNVLYYCLITTVPKWVEYVETDMDNKISFYLQMTFLNYKTTVDSSKFSVPSDCKCGN